MNINELIARIDELREKATPGEMEHYPTRNNAEPDDWVTPCGKQYPAFFTRNTDATLIVELWNSYPALRDELQRLQAQNDYMFAALELTEGRLKDKEATIEKARTYLRFGTGKLNSAEDMRYYIGEALAELDGLPSAAGGGDNAAALEQKHKG